MFAAPTSEECTRMFVTLDPDRLMTYVLPVETLTEGNVMSIAPEEVSATMK